MITIYTYQCDTCWEIFEDHYECVSHEYWCKEFTNAKLATKERLSNLSKNFLYLEQAILSKRTDLKNPVYVLKINNEYKRLDDNLFGPLKLFNSPAEAVKSLGWYKRDNSFLIIEEYKFTNNYNNLPISSENWLLTKLKNFRYKLLGS